jgi:hypothetical protein
VVAEGPDVGPGLALNPEEHETPFDAKDLQIMDGSDPETSLDCTFPRWPLVEPSGKFFCNFFDPSPVDVTVQSHQADIFLVVLEEEGSEADSIAEHDEQDTGYLRIERSGMPDRTTQHTADPGCDLVAGGSPWLVNNDDARTVPHMD